MSECRWWYGQAFYCVRRTEDPQSVRSYGYKVRWKWK